MFLLYGNILRDEINCNLDVEALCRAFPRRIQNLVKKQGGRLKV